MANKRTANIDFDEFLDYAKELDSIGEKYLREATEKAMIATAKYLNSETEAAMNKSKFNFKNTGDSMKSLKKVEAMGIEWDGYIAKTFVGVDLSEAPQELILSVKGTPHNAPDRNLYNALKGKGKHKKQVEKIQSDEFFKVLQEGMNG